MIPSPTPKVRQPRQTDRQTDIVVVRGVRIADMYQSAITTRFLGSREEREKRRWLLLFCARHRGACGFFFYHMSTSINPGEDWGFVYLSAYHRLKKEIKRK